MQKALPPKKVVGSIFNYHVLGVVFTMQNIGEYFWTIMNAVKIYTLSRRFPTPDPMNGSNRGKGFK